MPYQYIFIYINFFVEITIFRGSLEGSIGEIEEIAIVNDSISNLNSSITHLPFYLRRLAFFSVAQLPNGDILLAGGLKTDCISSFKSDEYLHYRNGSNEWTLVATMKVARYQHTSLLIDGCLFTAGGIDSFDDYTSHLEKFSFEGGVEQKKKMPIALKCHTATMFGNHKMLICGGQTSGRRFVVKHFLNYRNMKQLFNSLQKYINL